MKIKIGLYGTNGHQIHLDIENHPHAELVATADFDVTLLSLQKKEDSRIRHYESLEQMLLDDQVDLISLCSPKRKDQAADAIACLRAGKHVYAEKPCAMTEPELDAIIATARNTNLHFHEMAGTAFEEPYSSIGTLVRSGTLGEVVQVFVQKSYPFHMNRPQDELIDGGLICQNGIHALRLIEHVAGQKIKHINCVETNLGNPVKNGGLQMASSYMMELENGGIASAVANYLNHPGFKRWGNEHLRIFGTMGFVEAVDGGQRTRLIVGDRDLGEIEKTTPKINYFDLYLDFLITGRNLPLSLEDELHPTRMAIRAKQAARTAIDVR